MKELVCVLGLVSGLVYADQPPHRCPNVAILQEVGLSDNLVRDNDGKWYAGRTSQDYGTRQHWTFVIGGISAPTKQKALLEANEALATLRYHSGPSKAPADKWLCLYDNDDDLPSGAVTPPVSRLGFINFFR